MTEKKDRLPLYPDDPHSRLESVPETNHEIRRRHEANRAAWNEGAGEYTKDLEKSIEFIKAGKSNLHPVERQNLGDLSEWCHTAIHLQCASGQDTLSLAVEGVKQVVGVDISDVHIVNARKLSDATGIDARWYRCDVFDTPAELDGTADLVYTGRGAICWIQNLEKWAEVVARLLRPGGVFHIIDDNPITWLFRFDVPDLQASNINYLNHAESNKGWSESYLGNLGKPVEEETRKYERLWPLSAIAQALIDAGLTIEFIGEHAEQYWDNLPEMKPEFRKLIPMTFSIKAGKQY